MKTEEMTGPELGRAVLETMGWKISSEVKREIEYRFIDTPTGDPTGVITNSAMVDDDMLWRIGFDRKYLHHPHENAGDAIALLEEWRGREKARWWEIDSPWWTKTEVCGDPTFSCVLGWGNSDLEATGDTLAVAICRALVAWGESR